MSGRAHREIEADGRVVTPGFVDIHTHLDAQLAWDPIGTSSCWHGVTSVVMGNCGVTFAPCRPEDRSYLAELMESVEDIPRDAILGGLPWDWVTYGEYLGSHGAPGQGSERRGDGRPLRRPPARDGSSAAWTTRPPPRTTSPPWRSWSTRPWTPARSGSRPRGRCSTPSPTADRSRARGPQPDELFAFADVLGRHGRGVFEAASRLGERDGEDLAGTRAEMAWMGEVSRRSGRPVTFGLVQSDRRPELFRQIVGFAKEQNALGGCVRPQTTARGVGVLFGLQSRTPVRPQPGLAGPARPVVAGAAVGAARRGAAARSSSRRRRTHPPRFDLDMLFVLPPGPARYDCPPETSLAAHAEQRGVSAAAAFIELALETDGALVCNFPFLNQRLGAVEEMLDDPLVTLGLADAGAHVGQIMDASQPTFFLTYWIRERDRWGLEEAVRRLTSDTAQLFGIADRGVLRPGAFADVNVIDLEALTLHQPEFVHDFPGGAGRYVQGSSGYDYTLVNGEVFMDHGEHTGALPGRLLRSTD